LFQLRRQMKFFFIIEEQKCHSDQLKLAAQNLEDGEIKRSRLIIRKRHIIIAR